MYLMLTHTYWISTDTRNKGISYKLKEVKLHLKNDT